MVPRRFLAFCFTDRMEIVVREARQGLLDAKGEAHRDEVLAAAQAETPAISKVDLGNGLRPLLQQSKIRMSPEDKGLLPPEG